MASSRTSARRTPKAPLAFVPLGVVTSVALLVAVKPALAESAPTGGLKIRQTAVSTASKPPTTLPSLKSAVGPTVPTKGKTPVLATNTSSSAKKTNPQKSSTKTSKAANKTVTLPKGGLVLTSNGKPLAAAGVAGSSGTANGKIATTWSVSKTLKGWSKIKPGYWPEPGKVMTAVANANFVDVRREPSEGAEGLRFSRGKSVTGPVTFLVVSDYSDWLEVLLPVRPNGTTGWVRVQDMTRLTVHNRLVVELSTNTMIIETEGKEVYREKVSTGTGGTPTPTGLFFVRELVTSDKSDGPYGPFAYGLSGYSDKLNSFDGGEGAIGIHGTNNPKALGTAVSFGCVRLSNESLLRLIEFLPLGTPVEIVRTLDELPTVRRPFGLVDPVEGHPASTTPETTTPAAPIEPDVSSFTPDPGAP